MLSFYTATTLTYTHLLYTVRAFYLLASTAVLVCTTIPFLRSTLIPYGKALVPRSPSKQIHTPYTTFLRDTLSVPKRWFTHFYALGVPWSLYILYECLLSTITNRKGPLLTVLSGLPHGLSTTRQSSLEVILSQTLMSIQMARRLYECLAVSKPSAARMHLAHYAAGLLYYFFTPVAVGMEGWMNLSRDTSMMQSIQARHILGVALFLWASREQHRTHKQLAALRPITRNQPTYNLPTGPWFNNVSCPHYLFEMLIYLSFVVLTGGNTTCRFVLGWVVVDLSVAADQQWRWYKERFGKKVDRGWKRVVPFLF